MSEKTVTVVSVLAAVICGTFFYPAARQQPAEIVATPAAAPALAPEPLPPVLGVNPQPAQHRLADATDAAHPATDFRQGLAGPALP